jgi:hypothetical protein
MRLLAAPASIATRLSLVPYDDDLDDPDEFDLAIIPS